MSLNISILEDIIKSLSLIKIGFLFLNFALILFLTVVLIQVISMERVIREIHDSIILKFLAIGILLLAISLFVIAFVIL